MLNETKVHSRAQMEDTYNGKRNWKNRRFSVSPQKVPNRQSLIFYQTKHEVLLPYAGAALWVICNTTSGIPYSTDEFSSAFHYYISTTMADVQKLHSFVSPSQSFTA